MKKESGRYQGPNHTGAGRSSPYPVSRLSPAIDLVDLAREIAEADRMLNARVSSKLRVIADQIRALQQEARSVLTEAQRDQDLNHARCGFKRRPGHTYHLYRKKDRSTYFSLLSPEDWKNSPPHEFIGSFRLGNDLSWSSLGEKLDGENALQMVEHLLSAGKREEE